eukprot:CAMPEP_0113693442 /NCGR_PEP_ID=MMETSP0038_2-20120614/19666_1 /TAXON_ID=2898 /ORGANISM="Cryptomonas paramecium" /LENGTH=82 /DNA_ID=CAMNT_0000615513 /DNA_START=349 /DNA_END=594 /DNA_ORIENTATION=- /assembly_acc=CAM_ASM_000170
MSADAFHSIVDDAGRSLLMRAVVEGNVAAVRALLDLGLDPDHGGSAYSMRTPLMQAASAGDEALCGVLQAGGADGGRRDRFG